MQIPLMCSAESMQSMATAHGHGTEQRWKRVLVPGQLVSFLQPVPKLSLIHI